MLELYDNKQISNNMSNTGEDNNKISNSGAVKEIWVFVNCDQCSFVTVSQKPTIELRLHKTKVHYVCKVCCMKFENGNFLKDHFKLDHKGKNGVLRCSVDGCLKTMKGHPGGHAKFQNMYWHIQHVHKGVWLICDEMFVVDGKANQCKKKLPSNNMLKRHRGKGHKSKEKNIKPQNTKALCKVCGITLSSSYVRNHMNIAHGNLPLLNCSKCKFSTKYFRFLQYHEARHVSGIKCNLCDESLPSTFTLKKHKSLAHGEGEMFTCSFCDFKTWRFTYIKTHELKHNEKTIKCDQCNYKGTSTVLLKIHKLRHEDPKYWCEKCEYKTYDAGNFSTHKKVKHGTIILTCEECPSFKTKSEKTLRNHNSKHINDKIK